MIDIKNVTIQKIVRWSLTNVAQAISFWLLKQILKQNYMNLGANKLQ